MTDLHGNSSQVPLAPKTTRVQAVKQEHRRPIDRSELSSIVYTNYKSDMHNVSTHTVAGSTLPLVKLNKDSEAGDYNPFEHRKVSNPTTDSETLIHLLKGSLGSGILSMPLAFANAGLWFGLAATIAVGLICTYCVHILVKCAHILSRRAQVPSLGFSEVAETAFLAGPEPLHKWSRFARFLINFFLVIDLIGCCCVYNVFVAKNVKQVVEFYLQINMDVRLYICMLLVPLLVMNLIRSLKYLAPFSMLANCLMASGMAITMYYLLSDTPHVSERPAIVGPENWPMFFGTVIFALEGIGVVMSLENNMKNPAHFIGCPGVLNLGMGFVVSLYSLVGFLGYLRYGPETEPSITLNLPVEEGLAQSVKLMIAIAIFFTFSLQFYVPMEIIWKNVKHNFNEYQSLAEWSIRVGLIVLTVAIAAAVPNLGPFISLIGAVCLSTLGLMFPAIIEIIVYWEEPGLGRFNWRLWKNLLLIAFGIVGFLTGSYVSLLEIVDSFRHQGD